MIYYGLNWLLTVCVMGWLAKSKILHPVVYVTLGVAGLFGLTLPIVVLMIVLYM